MGLNIVYTDHSLFSFNDLACVNINKVIKCYLTDVDQTISVSNLGRDNLILRTMINPRICNVIPNALDFTKFRPGTSEDKNVQGYWDDLILNETIYIVFIARQTYRKGTDLLIEVIPEICSQVQNVKFIVGGDGVKRPALEKMVNELSLNNKVILLGALPHNKVREVMVKGHIFLNCSLTETFCTAIVEAASAGLYVVSTDVGGVGEVLPDYMITLVQPNVESISKGIMTAIKKYKERDTSKNYEDLKDTYNWYKVSRKTMKVYENSLRSTDRSFITRIKKTLTIGNGSGIFYLLLVLLDYLVLILLTIIQPKRMIKPSKDFDYGRYKEVLKDL